MALIKCRECFHEVSDKASTCPHCGAPLRGYSSSDDGTKKRLSPVMIIASILIGLIGGLILYFTVIRTPSSDYNPQPIDTPTETLQTVTTEDDNGDNNEDNNEQHNTDALVYMDLWGNIGEVHCKEFVMEGKAGHYVFDGPDNVKRTLELEYYDVETGQCAINAYLRGKYIGKFVGKRVIITGEHSGESYTGEFQSVKDVTLDFYLYVD